VCHAFSVLRRGLRSQEGGEKVSGEKKKKRGSVGVTPFSFNVPQGGGGERKGKKDGGMPWTVRGFPSQNPDPRPKLKAK